MSLRDRKVDLLSTQNLDFHGRRVSNAGDAQAPQDYVTLTQAKSLIDTVVVSQIMEVKVTDWRALSLLSSWVVHDTATYGIPSYRLVTLGSMTFFQLRGVIKNGTITDGTTLTGIAGGIPTPAFNVNSVITTAKAGPATYGNANLIFQPGSNNLLLYGAVASTVYLWLTSFMLLGY